MAFFSSPPPPSRNLLSTMINAKALAATPHGACVLSMLAIIGAIAALKAWFRLANGIWIYFLRPGKDLKKLGEFFFLVMASFFSLCFWSRLGKKDDDWCLFSSFFSLELDALFV